MQTNLVDQGALKRKLTIEIPFEEINTTYKRVWRRLRNVTIKGFRPGKQPKGWMESSFKDSMAQEAYNVVVPKYYDQARTELNLQVATQPKLEDLQFTRETALTFELTFEVKPELESIDFDKLNLEKKETEISDERVSDYIEYLLKTKGELTEREETDSVAEKDIVTINYQAYKDGELVEDNCLDGHVLEAGTSQDPIYGQDIMSKKLNDESEVTYTYPEDHKKFPGETRTYKYQVKAIKYLKVGEVSTLFEQFNVETEDDLKKAVVTTLEHTEKQSEFEQNVSKINDQLEELYGEFDLPESLLEEMKSTHVEKTKNQKQDITEEELNESTEKYLENVKKQLRVEYILDKVSLDEDIQPDDQAVVYNFMRYAQMLQKKPEDLIKEKSGSVLYERAAEEARKQAAYSFIIAKVLGEEEVAKPSEEVIETEEVSA